MAHKIRNYNFLSHFRYFVPGVVDFILLAVFFGLGILLGAGASMAYTLFLGEDADMQYALAISYPLMFIPAMLYASIRSRSNSYKLEGLNLDNWNVDNGPAAIPVVILATLAAAFCCDVFNSVMPPMPEYLKEAMEQMTSGNIWLNLLCIGVFAPFFEEWLCRGTVLRGLLGRGMKPVWSILISAAVFALIHANIWQAIPAFVMGLLFGYVYYRTGSLKLTMLMHCVNNSMALVLSHIDSFEGFDNWMQILPGKWYWLIFAAGIIVLVLSFLFFRKNGKDDAFEHVPPLFTT